MSIWARVMKNPRPSTTCYCILKKEIKINNIQTDWKDTVRMFLLDKFFCHSTKQAHFIKHLKRKVGNVFISEILLKNLAKIFKCTKLGVDRQEALIIAIVSKTMLSPAYLPLLRYFWAFWKVANFKPTERECHCAFITYFKKKPCIIIQYTVKVLKALCNKYMCILGKMRPQFCTCTVFTNVPALETDSMRMSSKLSENK